MERVIEFSIDYKSVFGDESADRTMVRIDIDG